MGENSDVFKANPMIQKLNYAFLFFCYKIIFKMEISNRAIDVETDKMIKDIAELYIRLEQKTQYLTNIQRYLQNRKRIKFCKQKHKFTPQSLINIIVQLSYFMYTCYRTKTIVYLSNDLMIRMKAGSDEEWELYLEYLLERELYELSESNQKIIKNRFHEIDSSRYESFYSKYLNKKLSQFVGFAFDGMNLQDVNIKQELEGVKKVLDLSNSLNKQTGEKPQVFIQCLEETKLFQAHSILLKTQNCSLYSHFWKKGKSFKQIRNQEELLYHNIKSVSQKQAKFLILEVLDKFIKQWFQSGFEEAERVNEKQDSIKKWQIRVQEKKIQQLTQQKIFHILRSQRINHIQNSKNAKQYNFFEIEYNLSKEIVSVKYLSDNQNLLENMDFLLCHCSNLMLEWTSAKVQKVIIPVKGQGKKIQKFIGFKIFSHLSNRNDPLRSILVMIDMAMIYGKIVQSQLQMKHLLLQDYNKFAMMTKKIDHLNQVFIRKIKNIYDVQQ